jgi:hypothetical protein
MTVEDPEDYSPGFALAAFCLLCATAVLQLLTAFLVATSVDPDRFLQWASIYTCLLSLLGAGFQIPYMRERRGRSEEVSK